MIEDNLNAKNMFYPFSYQKNIVLAKVLYSPEQKKKHLNIKKHLKQQSFSDINNSKNLNVLMKKYMIDYQKIRKLYHEPLYSVEKIINQDEYDNIKKEVLDNKEYCAISFVDIDINKEFNQFKNSHNKGIKGERHINDYNDRLERISSMILNSNKEINISEEEQIDKEQQQPKEIVDENEEYSEDFIEDILIQKAEEEIKDDSKSALKEHSNELLSSKIKHKEESFERNIDNNSFRQSEKVDESISIQ